MIILETQYAKRLGLPGYSSHQFSVTLKTEISDLTQVQAESARLYKLLQEGVDASIRESGYLPQNGNGNGGGNSHSNGRQNSDSWGCSPKQRDLIEKIVSEHKLEKSKVEALAQD